MLMNKIKFEEQANNFLSKLFETFDELEIEITSHWDIDHLCYRVGSLERYKELKTSFSSFGKLLIESEVNGRPIATYKLNFSIVFKNWIIDVVELPAPKLSKPTKEGFEHIEVVCDTSFKELEARYKHLKLDLGGLKKEFNQEFEIDLGERNVKFHQLSLESVIKVEENKKIDFAIKELNILKDFKSNTPFIIAPFLGEIQIRKSSLIILLHASDLDELATTIKMHYEKHDKFECSKTINDKKEKLIINFDFKHVSFELIAQTKPIVEQSAFKLFQVEERLLKLGGGPFKQKVMGFYLKGVERIQAVAEALELETNPYDELLKLQKASTVELINIFKRVLKVT